MPRPLWGFSQNILLYFFVWAEPTLLFLFQNLRLKFQKIWTKSGEKLTVARARGCHAKLRAKYFGLLTVFVYLLLLLFTKRNTGLFTNFVLKFLEPALDSAHFFCKHGDSL